jgi:PAS domain S-box-containing protein
MQQLAMTENNSASRPISKAAVPLENLSPGLLDDLLVATSDTVIIRGLSDGRIQLWNAAAEHVFGWSKEEALGSDTFALLHTTSPISRNELDHALRASGRWSGRLVHRSRDGREVVAECSMTLREDGGTVLEVHRDITLQLKAEQALRESDRLATMGRLAATIVHEINNPLAAIANLFYLLETHRSLDVEARAYAAAANNELERVSQITRRTLSFYRETRQQESLSPSAMLDDVLELQKRALQSAGIRVVREYGAASAEAKFPAELRQVLLNLVVNATQAMPSGGTLRLCIREAVDTVTALSGTSVSITDTGTGIRLEDRKHLFEPFFTTKAANGTGLGLWISKGILEKHGGRISYRCYRKGASNRTCFRVFFPGKPSQSDAAPVAETSRPRAALHAISRRERAACISPY